MPFTSNNPNHKQRRGRTYRNHLGATQLFLFLLLIVPPAACIAQITTLGDGTVIPGTEIAIGPGVDLSGWNTEDRNLRGANLSADWLQAGEELDLTGADFRGSWLDNAAFGHLSTSFAELIPKTNLTGTNFADATLSGARFYYANLTNANLTGTDLTDAQFGSNLTGANLTNAIITGTQFTAPSDGWAGSLASSGFAPEQLYSTLSYQEKDLRDTSYSGDLTEWNFTHQNLSGARFVGANLSDADLSFANLSGALFEWVDLADTDLSGANLDGARFIHHPGVDLSGADLSGADMTDVYISVRDIDGANLSNARLVNTFIDVYDLESLDGKVNLAGANLKNSHLDYLETVILEFSSDTVYNQWTLLPANIDPVAAGLTFEASPVGDFDANDVVDKQDFEMLVRFLDDGFWQWEDQWRDRMFDLNEDRTVDQHDMQMWITDVKRAVPGDANFDGEFNSTDFVEVFKIGKYESGEPAGWTEGDWNFDERFDSGDFVVAFQDGRYEKGPNVVAAVPEPSASVMLIAAGLGTFARRRLDYHSAEGMSLF